MEPATIVLPLPIVRPGKRVTPPPIQQSLSMVIFLPRLGPLGPNLLLKFTGNIAVYILTCSPILYLPPILCVCVSRIVKSLRIVISWPMLIFLLLVEVDENGH